MCDDARIQGRCPKVSLWYAPCAGSSRRATPKNSWRDKSPAAPRFLPSRPQLWEPRGGHGVGTLLWSQGRGRTRHRAWSAATPGRKCAQVLAEAPHEHLLLTADGSAGWSSYQCVSPVTIAGHRPDLETAVKWSNCHPLLYAVLCTGSFTGRCSGVCPTHEASRYPVEDNEESLTALLTRLR